MLRESGVSTVLEWRHCGKANSLNGGSQKGTAENYNCKPSFQILCACSPSLPCVVLCCSSSLFLFVRLAAMVTLLMVTSLDWLLWCMRVAGTIVVLIIIIFFHFRATLTGIASGTVQLATLCVSFSIQANTTNKLYTFFK